VGFVDVVLVFAIIRPIPMIIMRFIVVNSRLSFILIVVGVSGNIHCMILPATVLISDIRISGVWVLLVELSPYRGCCAGGLIIVNKISRIVYIDVRRIASIINIYKA